uniref:Non-LTR retroelement reverse transcriptase n=1 Tax=Solanum tuberosum TaxID=4113 RepID=M1A275_SOLTU
MWSTNLNHLAYADDTIIFASSNEYPLRKVMQVLQQYESQSGQKVKKEKSFFYTHQNTSRAITEKVGDITSMAKGVFPFKYLGCPVSHSRKRKEHFVELIDRV